MWTVKLSKQATEFLESLTGKHLRQVSHALDLVGADPRQGKPLKGDLQGYWSFRVGVYRMIYAIYETEVVVAVLRIHHRKEVYERMRR